MSRLAEDSLLPAARNIADWVWQGAEQRRDQVALREASDTWTYAELRDQVVGAVEKLRAEGVSEGDRVLMVVPTSSEFVFLIHAIHAMGAVAVTVNPMSTAPELEYFLDDAECVSAIGWHDTAEPLRRAAQAAGVRYSIAEPGSISSSASPLEPVVPAEDDPAVLIYTSGTTGQPKGAVLTHANVLICGDAFRIALGLEEDDRMGTGLPLFHVFGQAAVMATVFAAGASLSILRPFTGTAMLQMAADHQLTAMAGVPTMWNEMLHAPTDLTRETSSGCGLPPRVEPVFPLKSRQPSRNDSVPKLLRDMASASRRVAPRLMSPGRPTAKEVWGVP